MYYYRVRHCQVDSFSSRYGIDTKLIGFEIYLFRFFEEDKKKLKINFFLITFLPKTCTITKSRIRSINKFDKKKSRHGKIVKVLSSVNVKENRKFSFQNLLKRTIVSFIFTANSFRPYFFFRTEYPSVSMINLSFSVPNMEPILHTNSIEGSYPVMERSLLWNVHNF